MPEAVCRATVLWAYPGSARSSWPRRERSRRVVCVQNRYGLEASAADHTLLDLCGTQGIVFVPFFAIAGPAVSAIARAHDATPAQVRLAWTLHRGPHVLAIPGTGDPVHLTENIDAAALRLSPQEISSLAATPLPSYPHPSDPPT